MNSIELEFDPQFLQDLRDGKIDLTPGEIKPMLGERIVDLTKPLLLYLASPYRAETDFGVLQNINSASKIASELWGMGHYCFCPVMNSAMMHRTSHARAEHFLEGDLVMLSKCDGIVLSPDWETSEGAKGEYAYAQEKGMLTWIWPSCPPPPESVSGDSE